MHLLRITATNSPLNCNDACKVAGEVGLEVDAGRATVSGDVVLVAAAAVFVSAALARLLRDHHSVLLQEVLNEGQ
eukprot:3323808-Pleurochrysis_carterae.AAC.1